MEGNERRFAKEIRRNVSGVREDFIEPGEWGRLLSLERRLAAWGIPLEPGKKVLEIGSATGIFLDQMREKGIDAVGIDARPRGKGGAPHAAARIEQLPFPDRSFDFVISSSVFDDIVYDQDQAGMLQEIRRVLQPGGVFVSNADLINQPPQDMEIISPETSVFLRVYKKV